MRRDRVAVTGIGVVCAAGWTAEDVWCAIEAEQSGLKRLTLFHSPRHSHVPVGQVTGEPGQKSGLRKGSRPEHLAVCAARCAVEH